MVVSDDSPRLEVGVAELQTFLESGRWASLDLVQLYADRIEVAATADLPWTGRPA